ncbi:MAG: hybrid-cluster NAD(P)-dependent oxidoreductase [Gammaproteobacteria bacterium]|nr:hybrid-cluster NAD(P)-dependent oxidoreductase [Gammaproteobacteria bacterium]
MLIKDLEAIVNGETWSSRKTLAQCVNVIEETPDVKTFQFKAIDGQLFHFKPGQFIGIQLEINGEKHNRSYTIASSPTRPHLLHLTIKKDEDGVISPWLHENIIKGSEIELRGPAGSFNCVDVNYNPASDKVLLISAGSGITPLMSMTRFWTDMGSDHCIHFINWARSTQDIIFRRELSLLDQNYKNFNLEVILTNPGLTENWLGKRGRITTNLLSDLVADIKSMTVFCCGPEGFMDQVKKILESLDFDMNYYHDESFDPGGKKKAKTQNQASIASDENNGQKENNTGPFNVKLKKSGRSFLIESNDILLEKLEEEKVSPRPSCRAGNCGCCQVKKISGETLTQNENGLMKDEKEDGFILTCTTTVHSDIELDL